MGYGSFSGLTSLKDITIPKTVKGFYNNENTAFTYLGFYGDSKISDFTIRGYKTLKQKNMLMKTDLDL